MNASGCMRALRMAGRIILENGGETYRAEDTVIRMAHALGLEEPDAFAIPSGLFISFTDESGERITSVSRVHLRGTRLMRVDRVNQISRMLTEGLLDADELISALQQASHIGSDTPRWYAPLTAFISAAGFAVMFGGGVAEFLLGGLCAMLTQMVPLLLRGRDSGGMAGTLLGSVLCALIPLLFHEYLGQCLTEAIIAAAIMPLVPGLSMTNAMQDILRGDMMSGVSHCARAIMIAIMVAGGTLVGTHLAEMLGVTLPADQTVSMAVNWQNTAVIFLSSTFAGMAFGALLYAPRRAYVWGGLLGGVGYTAYWLIWQNGSAETTAIFVGALIASLGAQVAARRLKMIATAFVTTAILPLVPGLGLYRAMRMLAQGQTANGLAHAAHTMALIVMIALGIGLGAALRKTPRPAVRKG